MKIIISMIRMPMAHTKPAVSCLQRKRGGEGGNERRRRRGDKNGQHTYRCSVGRVLPRQVEAHTEHGKHCHECVGADGQLVFHRRELVAGGQHVASARVIVGPVHHLVVLTRLLPPQEVLPSTNLLRRVLQLRENGACEESMYSKA